MKKEVAEYILKNHRVEFTGKRTIIIDQVKDYTFKTFWEFGLDILSHVVDAETQVKFFKDFPTDTAKAKFFTEIAEILKAKKKQASREKFGGGEDIPRSRAMVNYVPVISLNDNDKFLINPDTKEISEVNYDAYFETLHKEQKEILKEQMRLAKFVYDPYDLDTLVMDPFENYELLKVNTYKPPQWRKREPSKQSCPRQIERVLSHLFPTEESLEYVLDWLYHALVSRNEAYLVLNGAKGIGKGVFCSIAKALVGAENYTEAPESFLESQFNSALDRKRVIVLDELKVDKAKHTKLKRYINKYQNIEKKGRDADKAVETFNSFIISNNDETDMYLEYDDRRFSAPDIAVENLTETMKGKEIRKLLEEIDDPDSDLIYQFGYFIYFRGAKKYDEFGVFKGDKYHKLVETSLKMWQKKLLEAIVKGENQFVNVDEVRQASRVKDGGKGFFPYQPQRIRDFLNNFRYQGDIELGELVKIEGEWEVKVNPYLLKDGVEEEEDSKEDIL